MTSKFDGWPWKTTGHIFSATSSIVHHFIDIYQFKMELQSGNPKFGQNRPFFVLCDLEIWRMTLKNNMVPLFCYFNFCASFHSHLWNQKWGYSPETPNLGQNQWFLAATKQLYEWYFLSVCLSVCPSVCLSVTPFWLCSHHRIIMKFLRVITNDKSDVHAKGQGQRSKVKVTEVNTQLNRFRTVTPVWIHIWWWNDA